MKKRKKRRTFIENTKHFICFLLVFCMTFVSVPVTSFAEETESSVKASSGEHVLNEANNWSISNEFILPGESFYIEPKYEVQYEILTAGAEEVGARIILSNAGLTLGSLSTDINKLVRSTADTSNIVPGKTNIYNVIKMAYDKGDLVNQLSNIKNDDEKNQGALTNALNENAATTVNAGYVNNTTTPIVLYQLRTSSSKEEGKIYGGEFGLSLLVSALSTQRSDCAIRFYEPYYTLTYRNLLEGEKEQLPDRYYVKNEQQDIVLPDLIRPGYHFKEWTGGLFFADKIDDGEKTVYTFSGYDLLNAGYNWGDETLSPSFTMGYTVTFNPNGGTIGGKESVIYELDRNSETFFDISKYVPEREGYTFDGWCSYPSADDNSLIKDTDSYDWVDQWVNDYYSRLHSSMYDIHLYAKWTKNPEPPTQPETPTTPTTPDKCANGHTPQKTVTKATVKNDGKIVTTCSVCKKTLSTVTIPRISGISLSSSSYTYNGKERKPSVTVKDRTGKKISTANYTVSYAKGLKTVGSYGVTIKLKGNYSGTVKKTFTIVPKSTIISSLTAGKKKVTVKWNKQTTQTTGYQIQYSTSSKFKSAKTVTVSKNKTTSTTISKLLAKKKYYVRIRTYKTVKVNGKSTKLYSFWSKTKTVTVK